MTDARVTQACILVLADYTSCVTKWATGWKITRTDGEIFAFTDHDKDVIYQGVTYKTCDSLSATAIENSANIGAIGNTDLRGIIDDDSITDTDLYGGLFDQAKVEIALIPWGEASIAAQDKILLSGLIGTISHGDTGFQAEVLTDGALLQQKSIIDVYTPSCRFDLGDTRCKVNLDALAVTGTVTAITIPTISNNSGRRIFIDSGRTEDSGYFDQGRLTWLTGDNTGLTSEVKSFSSGNIFILWDFAVYPILVGDTYRVTPGCDKLESTCKTKFDNFVNFGGFNLLPGQDAVIQSAPAK